MLITHESDREIYACIIEHGIEAVTVNMVAERLGRSRTTFYRQYRNRRALLTATHRRTLLRLDSLFPMGAGDLRLQFEEWWATMMKLFRSPLGRAFLALRPYVATRHGMHEVEHYERELLPGLQRWLRAPAAVTHAVWAMVLSASTSSVDDRGRGSIRELVWSMIEPWSAAPGRNEEVDWSDVRPLAEPIAAAVGGMTGERAPMPEPSTWNGTSVAHRAVGYTRQEEDAGARLDSESGGSRPTDPRGRWVPEPSSWDGTPVPRRQVEAAQPAPDRPDSAPDG